MTLAYMRYGTAADVPSVITVHNLAFQGQFGAEIFGELGLPPQAMALDGVEYYGGVGYLKAGLQRGLGDHHRQPDLCAGDPHAGIRHGPRRPAHHARRPIWSASSTASTPTSGTRRPTRCSPRISRRERSENRAVNRRAVEERFGLEQDDSPLLCVVSRLTWQKGIDILAAIGRRRSSRAGAKLAVLGAGDQALEGALLAGAARHRGRVGVVIGYDEGLSHLMQGGCDAILIPSRFEPCGLTQLYGLRYGCVPVVARTGGLADTVIDANEAAVSAGVATGFQFAPNNGDAFMHAIRRVVAAHANKPVWTSMQKQGMKADVSWARSAARYVELYKSLIAKRQGQA